MPRWLKFPLAILDTDGLGKRRPSVAHAVRGVLIVVEETQAVSALGYADHVGRVRVRRNLCVRTTRPLDLQPWCRVQRNVGKLNELARCWLS